MLSEEFSGFSKEDLNKYFFELSKELKKELGRNANIEMKIIIKRQGTLAIYEQIVNQLKNAILTGKFSAGDTLPSIRSLAAELEVSVITTKRVYEELKKEKLVCSIPGKGFYVCGYNRDFLKEKQYIELEERMLEVIRDCKKAGMNKQDVISMIETKN